MLKPLTVALAAVLAAQALRPSRTTTAPTMVITRPRATETADRTACSVVPPAAKNNIIPYTAPSKAWQPGERRREVDRQILHPYFRLGAIDDKTGERFLGGLKTLRRTLDDVMKTFVASEWSREHELRDASREFVASEWKREAALRASTQKFLERDDAAIAEAVASTQQFLERDDVAVAEAVAQVVCAAAIVPPLVLLAPLLVPMSVAHRKDVWNRATRQSRADHVAAFDAAVDAYRADQRDVVEALAAAEARRTRPARVGRVAVTMATSQEGAAVVAALVADGGAARPSEVVALVRDPASPKARALAALDDRVTVVAYDATDAASIRAGLEGCAAAYLCTTLNKASAGTWAMDWTGGAYELDQGRAFAEACADLDGLEQVIYGTAPVRKWPDEFVVEPPIHYAAKWEIEKMLEATGVALTALRKCPYHENFTKLTKSGAGPDGTWKPGNYQIKALTPPDFTYNMLDPKDIGPWAALAFAHRGVLASRSLSIASDCLSGAEMARDASECLGDGVKFSYAKQPRLIFEVLAFVEPTFVYISGLQRWNSDGGAHVRRADIPPMNRGDVAAATRIVRGDETPRLRRG